MIGNAMIYTVCYPNGRCLRIRQKLPVKRVLGFKVYPIDYYPDTFLGALKWISSEAYIRRNYYVYGSVPAVILRSLYWLRDKVYWRSIQFLVRSGFFASKPNENIRWRDFMVLPSG